jgi:hypothetical protein
MAQQIKLLDFTQGFDLLRSHCFALDEPDAFLPIVVTFPKRRRYTKDLAHMQTIFSKV